MVRLAALSSATQHAMPPELGGKWGTECLNTRFPLPAFPLSACQREAGKILEQVNKVVYLGCRCSRDGRYEMNGERRVAAGNIVKEP